MKKNDIADIVQLLHQTSLAETLPRLLAKRTDVLFDFKVRGSLGGVVRYDELRIIHSCSQLIKPLGGGMEGMIPARVRIVARGDNGEGPFVFLWPTDGVDPDQPACNGMPLIDIISSQ